MERCSYRVSMKSYAKALKVSTQGAYEGWQMKQERKSPNYTTSWEDVPLV